MIKFVFLVSLISASSATVEPLVESLVVPLETLLNPLFYTTEESVIALINYLEDALNLVLQTEHEDRPIEEDVKLFSINRETNERCQVFLNDSDLSSKVNVSKPVVFVIHGWSENSSEDWINALVPEWLKYFDTNLILVDYGRIANFQYWDTALEGAPKVANYTAEFIQFLVENGVSLNNVQLIGFSLGGQVAGLIGAHLNGEIAKIYGLDVAGLLFTHPTIKPPSERLDPTDAKHVQCIYTTAGVTGSSIPLGHENYYVNGGYALQPMCIVPNATEKNNLNPLWCSHKMSPELFMRSLNPNCVFTGSYCEEWNLLGLLTLCGKRITERFGPYSSGKYGYFHFETGLSPPYCEKESLN